ncbi:MAG TPA: GAF domain-containing protein [Candidatus Dormibacteraeota bacterium]|nr:GAF domain-containing protein [Candidatus Dormibacteraeota bacterium]
MPTGGSAKEAALAAATTAGLGGYGALVEAMPDGVVIADVGGRLLYVNHLAEELSGYGRNELVGLSIENLVPERFRGAHGAHRAQYASKPQKRAMGSGLALHLLRKDGTELAVDIALHPIETPAGVIVVAAIRAATDPAAADRAQRALGHGQDGPDRAEGRLIEEIRRSTVHVTEAILEGRDAENVMRLIVHHARELLRADGAVGLSVDASGGSMIFRMAEGLGDDIIRGLQGSLSDSISGEVMRTGRPFAIGDVSNDHRMPAQLARVKNFGPALFVPLVVRSRAIGIIDLVRERGRAAFSDEDLKLALLFAAHAAVVLEYGRNQAERQKAERRVAAGMEVTQAIIAGRDTTEVLQLIAGRARDLVGAVFAAICSPEADGNHLIARVADGENAAAYRGARLPVANSLTGRVFRTRQSLTVADAADDAAAYQPVLRLGNLGPALIVPLYVVNRSVGAMIVANQRGGAPFTQADLSLVESFAAQAAMSVEIATVRERLQRLTSVTIAGQEPLEDALSALARTVVEATDTIACGIYLLDADHHLTIAGTYGLPAGFARVMANAFRQAGARFPQMDAIENRIVVVNEQAISRLLSQPVSDPAFEPAREMLRGVSWDTLVTVPLMLGERVVGALSGYYPRGYSLTNAEVAFLKIVAGQLAVMAENARLFTDAQANVAHEERQRLARELHDSVSQALFGIGLGARTAREHLERDPEAARAPLDYVLQLAEAGLAEMRALIFELRPESLEKEGLVGAMAKQAAAVRARHGIAVNEVFDAEPEAPIAVKEALFRIAQEALTNTAKHARASYIELRLSSVGEALVVEIRDDGAGFDAGAQFPGHLGLHSMRERALRLGGNVDIVSSAGQGTLVRAMIPVGARS